jgi:hypothetical protein
MIKLGQVLTVYIFLSFILFLTTSFTITGWIIYGILLLPFYATILLVSWLTVWQNRTKTAQIKYWIWGIVLVLQVATILASSGNCYGVKQGARCYSNIQILLGNVPRNGSSNLPHWQQIEDAFPKLLLAYGASVVVALATTSIREEPS